MPDLSGDSGFHSRYWTRASGRHETWQRTRFGRPTAPLPARRSAWASSASRTAPARFDILSAGQDIQLHLHPNWLHFRYPDWMERLSGGHPSPFCSGRSVPYATQGVVTEICGAQRLDEECCRKTKACKGTKNERQPVFLPLSGTIGMRFTNRAQFRRVSERAANAEFCINRQTDLRQTRHGVRSEIRSPVAIKDHGCHAQLLS